ncbi:Release factor glutamine methyltransferase [Hypsizygus marmoreus]|uniref:Release factor glutamine methyltransferase n=1 Tax=Hypsizygus marmoreus TaxID=39966 RepID=A0A369JU36_HYPMA|nr:Release factor glutamine methyltransferase [Hypsizygus marmoreus]
MHSKLIAALVQQLGPAQARQEFRWMLKHSEHSLPDMVRRRCLGEPLQYILGSQPFGPLNLLIRPPVLIPRPETEDWVLKLADRISTPLKPPKYLLDLGTGSGCIPLLLCHLLPPGTLHAHGVDISPHAIQLATDNAALYGIPPHSPENTASNTFKTSLGNLLAPSFCDDAKLQPPYDIVTSNPPYISWNEYLELPRSVANYEDPKALFGGPTGLDFYHAIARLVRRDGFLRPGAIVALEIGHEQGQDVEHIMRVEGQLHDTEVWSDPWGKQRTVLAYR